MTRITGQIAIDAPADGNGSQPPGQSRAGAALLAARVAGVALAPLALRRLSRGGSLLIAAGCRALFARDAQMTLTGGPARQLGANQRTHAAPRRSPSVGTRHRQQVR